MIEENTKGASPILLLEWWKPVVGFEGVYQVSNTGRLSRVGKGKNGKSDYPIKTHPVDKSKVDGYLQVNFWRKGKSTGKLLHRVVAESFIGPCPDEHEVNHKDVRPRNCFVSNLEYVIRSTNMLHALDATVRKGGVRSKNHILTKDEVLEIAALRGKARSSEIAKNYAVGRHAIYDILSGRRWGWLTGIERKDSGKAA